MTTEAGPGPDDQGVSSTDSLFDDLIENAPLLIQTVDARGRVLYANRTWRETLGYSPPRDGYLSIFDVLAPENVDHCRDLFLRMLDGSDIGAVAFTFVDAAGTRVDVEGTITAKFEDGVFVNSRGVFTDISARRKAEAEARRLEMLRAALLAIVTRTPSTITDPGEKLADALRHVTEVGASGMAVARVGIWSIAASEYRLDALDLWDRDVGRHETGTEIHTGADSKYLAALTTNLTIAASDARTDPRTREFANGYLDSLGIGAMLDATVRSAGAAQAVVCFEHVGNARIWTDAEIEFATAVAIHVGQLLSGHEIAVLSATLSEINEDLEARVRAGYQELSEFRATLDGYQDAVFLFDPDNLEFFYANRGAYGQLGLEYPELIGRHPYDFTPEFPEPKFRELIAPLIAGKTDPLVLETVHRHRDGSLIPVEVSLQLIRPHGGNARFLNIVRDISDKLAVRAELDTESRYRAILIDGTADAIIAGDPDGRITIWNPAAERMLGWTAAERIGTPVGQALDPAEIREYALELSSELGQSVESTPRAIALAALQGRPETREWSFLHKDGHRGTAALTVSVLSDEQNEPSGFVVIARDITQAKALEEASARDAAFRASLIESAGDGIAAYDRNGIITVWNPALERMVGWTAAEKLGTLQGNVIDPAEVAARAEELSAEYGRTVEPGPEVFGLPLLTHTYETREWTYIAKNGTRIPVLQTSSAIRLDGRIIGYLAISRDISAIKEARASLQSREEAARAAAEELRLANQRLEASNRDLNLFAFAASHDLREPLRSIAGFTELLLERNSGNFDPESTEFARHIVEASSRMSGIIEDVLAFSRIGHSEGEVGEVDCPRLLDEVLLMADRMVRESGATCVRDNHLPMVLGERSELISLFLNLITNSIKFRSTDPPRVHIGSEPGDETGFVEFYIRDNGIGIPDEFHDRAFAIFTRLERRTSVSGSGVGLALCRKIVESRGGRIWIEPGRTDGTTVRFTLPVSRGAPEDAIEATEETDSR